MPTDFFSSFFSLVLLAEFLYITIFFYCWYSTLLIPHTIHVCIYLYSGNFISFTGISLATIQTSLFSLLLPLSVSTFVIKTENYNFFFVPFGLKLIFTVLWRVGGNGSKHVYLCIYKLYVVCVCVGASVRAMKEE